MAESSTEKTSRHAFEKVRGHSSSAARLSRRCCGKPGTGCSEQEFIDRSIALAGKAFISFFPLIIVVATLIPPHLRTSILACN